MTDTHGCTRFVCEEVYESVVWDTAVEEVRLPPPLSLCLSVSLSLSLSLPHTYARSLSLSGERGGEQHRHRAAHVQRVLRRGGGTPLFTSLSLSLSH
jgi:hypothetical protein